jgi:hypothetical protein
VGDGGLKGGLASRRRSEIRASLPEDYISSRYDQGSRETHANSEMETRFNTSWAEGGLKKLQMKN